MATQQALFLGLMLILVTHGRAVLADLQEEALLHSKDLLYQSRSQPLPDAAQSSYNLSSQCQAEIERLLYSDPKTRDAAVIMALDAFGKPPAGILQANWAWLGHYDECMAIEGFNYCLVDMALNTTMLDLPKNVTSSFLAAFKIINIRWGICPPANCTENDIHAVLQELLDALKILDGIITTEALTEAGAVCTKKPTIPYGAGVICTIILCGFIASLMIVGALYDESTKLLAKWRQRQRRGDNIFIARPLRLLDDTDEDGDDEPLLNDVGTAASVNNEVDVAKKQSLAVRLLLCFALNRNLAKLMDVKQGDASIAAINGIRVISMFWVMLGHTIVFGFSVNITDNLPTLANWIQTHWGFQAVANAFFSVDSFFFLSGFLLAYLTFGRFRELSSVKTWALFYFHRYWRWDDFLDVRIYKVPAKKVDPPFAFTILIWMYIPQFLGEGPVWQSGAGRPFCPKYWWTGLLYINNFWPTSFGEECIAWTWYLANDMQFFVISPLLMVPLFYWPIFGWLALCAALLASFISTGLIIGFYDLGLNILSTFSEPQGADYSSLVYGKPYCRIAPYLVGIALGYIMHRIGKRKVRMTPVLALIGWLAAAAMAMSVVYGLYPSYQTPLTRAATIVYGSISRFVWALSLAWVVFACKYGYGGWINSFLSWSAWVPLGRVTYSAYMFHPIVMFVFYDNFATTWHFSVYLMAFYFAALVAVSYFVAVIVALAIEYPFANLEKVLLPALPRGKTVDGSGERTRVINVHAETRVVTRGSAYERGIADSRREDTN